MKLALHFISLLFFVSVSFSQSYELVDKKVSLYPDFNSIEALSYRIQNDFDTDSDRARAVFYWIANNISYDVVTSKLPRQYITFRYRTDAELKKQKKEYHKRLAQDAFEKRITLCGGYSMLFVELCNLMGIDAKMIKGVTKVSPLDINQIKQIKDHAWNAVYLNGHWKLIDITWSAGYRNPNTGKFLLEFNDLYYLPTAQTFLASHYPADMEWQLIDQPIDLVTFFERPLFYPDYFDSGYKITDLHVGNLKTHDKKVLIEFDSISGSEQLYYRFEEDARMKPLYLKRQSDNTYVAQIKNRKLTSTSLTIYANKAPIIDFKIN